MLEPEYSIPQLLDAGAVPPGVGFLAALEAQGYLADPGAAPTTILAGWSVAQAAASGAAAAKLLLPYHPDHALAEQQEHVAADVLAECRRVGIPLVLEPLFFGLADPHDRPAVVLRTAERFAALGPDLLKLPFPVDTTVEPDRDVWAEHCRAITERCPMPWAILSGGGSFDDFATQVEVATAARAAAASWSAAPCGARRPAPPPPIATAVIADIVLPRWHRLCAITITSSTRSGPSMTATMPTQDYGLTGDGEAARVRRRPRQRRVVPAGDRPRPTARTAGPHRRPRRVRHACSGSRCSWAQASGRTPPCGRGGRSRRS